MFHSIFLKQLFFAKSRVKFQKEN